MDEERDDMKTAYAASLGLTLLLASAPAHAQSDMKGMSHHDHGAAAARAAPDDPASKAYRDANAKMHADMGVTLSGDADADFLRSMIPHHQGAIDMAKIVLRYGKDPAVRKLAEDIVAAQEREIAEMNERLAAFEKARALPK